MHAKERVIGNLMNCGLYFNGSKKGDVQLGVRSPQRQEKLYSSAYPPTYFLMLFSSLFGNSITL